MSASDTASEGCAGDDLGPLAEHLFRDRWRDVIAALARRFGSGRLEEIEDAVQGAFLKALDRWALGGVPENPGGWIYTVARNALLDRLRREGRAVPIDGWELPETAERDEEAPWVGPLADDVLRMVLVCAHPRLKPRESLAVTLRLVCGLGLHEIASALLIGDEAAHKLLTRTKAKIREARLPLDPPDRSEQARRLDRVLQLVYLLFNEGYSAHTGEELLRPELCREAERLLDLLLESEAAEDGRVWALAALVAFQGSRLPARVAEDGRPRRLGEQDRTLWDRGRIARGFAFLERSIEDCRRSRYHLEAAIAACHAAAPSYEETDWPRILELYDDLSALVPSSIVALNRAVALSMVRGPEAAIMELERLGSDRSLAHSYLLPTVLGDVCRRAGRQGEAATHYSRARRLARNGSVRRFIEDRLADISIQ